MPIFSRSISARPSTVTFMPCRFAMSRAVSARKSGVQRLPGIMPRRARERVLRRSRRAARTPRLARRLSAARIVAA